MKKILPYSLLLLLMSCSPTNLNELRSEVDAQMKQLTEELREMGSKDDVLRSSKKLKKRFNKIAQILISSRQFEAGCEEKLENRIGEELFTELARLYEIPGVREAIEATQSDAIRALDKTGR